SELHLSRGGKDFVSGHFAAPRRAFAPPAAQRSLRFGFVSLVEKTAHDDRSQVRERARGIKFRRAEFRHRRLQLRKCCRRIRGQPAPVAIWSNRQSNK